MFCIATQIHGFPSPLHGDPDGLRVIDQPNWSGVGIAFPRASYKEVSQRDEFNRTGVYILVGPGLENSALPTLYIGQSDRVKTRLDSHHKNKDFWEWGRFPRTSIIDMPFLTDDAGAATYVLTQMLPKRKDF